MIASSGKEHEVGHVVPLNNRLRILKSAVLYGANASGKSNLFKAMRFVATLVFTSSKDTQATEKIKVTNYKLSSETENRPCYFEVIFQHKNVKYKYGFEVDVKKVHKEWLFYAPKGKETKLFIRHGRKIDIGLKFKEGKGLIAKTRDNALFLSVAAQFNGPIAIGIMKWFDSFRIISGLDDLGYRKFAVEKLKNAKYKVAILKFLKEADLGIEDIHAETVKIQHEKLPKEVQAFFKAIPKDFKELFSVRLSAMHKKYNAKNKKISQIPLDFDAYESEGTKKLFSLSAPIIDTLKTGKTVVVDELDARLHPVILRFLISLFNSPQNQSKAQLIFASHDTNILSNKYFRRDQIWFTEKDKYGATDLYSLADYSIRKDASFEKDYILGKYGAIPFINNADNILDK